MMVVCYLGEAERHVRQEVQGLFHSLLLHTDINMAWVRLHGFTITTLTFYTIAIHIMLNIPNFVNLLQTFLSSLHFNDNIMFSSTN